MRKMRAQAESLRDALIGSVSHELRTPLAAIIGSASILSQSPAVAGDGHLSSLVRVVRKEAERLNGDIQNLLDATRISSDGIRPQMEWVDPEDMVSAALARKRPMLTERQLALSVADDLPLAYVDPSLIESALGQLIENAAKYSPAGTSIAIGARTAATRSMSRSRMRARACGRRGGEDFRAVLSQSAPCGQRRRDRASGSGSRAP